MQKDPVCEMKVNESTQYKSVYKGVTYFFCSVTCKMLFDRDPVKYISAAQTTPKN